MKGVAVTRIVEAFGEAEHGAERLNRRLEPVSSGPLAFQRAREALGYRVVVGIAHRTHRGTHAASDDRQRGLILTRTMLLELADEVEAKGLTALAWRYCEDYAPHW